MTKREARVKGAVLLLHGRGEFPTPTKVAELVGIRRGGELPSERARRGARAWNGWQDGQTARWRREALAELGYGRHLVTGRFHAPKDVAKNPGAYTSPIFEFRTHRARLRWLQRAADQGFIKMPDWASNAVETYGLWEPYVVDHPVGYLEDGGW